jgi:hypothetical protein
MLRSWIGDWIGTFLGESNGVLGLNYLRQRRITDPRPQRSSVVDEIITRRLEGSYWKCRFLSVGPLGPDSTGGMG